MITHTVTAARRKTWIDGDENANVNHKHEALIATIPPRSQTC